MACIAEATTGFPNSNGHIPFECATIAEVLGERGWNTYMLGKWHLVAADEMNMASTKRNWPVGRGFERYYGFLGGETNQWYPDLVYDNHPVEQPATPEEGYHLTTDLTDKAIEFIRDAKVIAPDKPFFMYFCPGATHAPHHAPKEWIEKYKGKFDMGYEAYRELVFERQKKMGIFPEDAELTPLNPYAEEKSVDGKPWTAARRGAAVGLAVRRREAAVLPDGGGVRRLPLATPTTRSGGCSTSSRSPASSRTRSSCSCPTTARAARAARTARSTRTSSSTASPTRSRRTCRTSTSSARPPTYNHYPVGWAWAFNTPFKMWKRYNFEGGVADPMVISWPKGIKAKGELRHQFLHATDIVPTMYDLLGVELPGRGQGLPADPARGRELPLDVRERRRADAEGDRLLLDARLPRDLAQGLEGGQRPPDHRRLGALRPRSLGALQHRARTRPRATTWPPRSPTKVQELINLWFHEAGKYNGLPLLDKTAVEVLADPTRPQIAPPRDRYVYYPDTAEVPETAAVNIRNRSYTIAVEVEIESEDAAGVLFSHGARFGGHALYVKDRKLKYVYNFVGDKEQIVESTKEIPTGQRDPRRVVRARGRRDADHRHAVALHRRREGRRGPDHDPARQLLARRRGPERRQGPGEPVTDDYPGSAPVRVHRRHDQGGDRRRLGRAVTSTSRWRPLAMMKRE